MKMIFFLSISKKKSQTFAGSSFFAVFAAVHSLMMGLEWWSDEIIHLSR